MHIYVCARERDRGMCGRERDTEGGKYEVGEQEWHVKKEKAQST